MSDQADIAIIGAGAAGLMAAIWAGRTALESGVTRRIVLLDGAKHIGAKILVAGGGRCNVTHDVVDESAYAGSSRISIRNVLRRFDVPSTIEFFREIGVELKREDTGKLFPVTDEARTVLEALLREAKRIGVVLRHPWRVQRIRWEKERFIIESNAQHGPIEARRVVLATGGKSLPKTGSDGAGYELAESLGHSISQRIFPALVPLLLAEDDPLRALSGISARATLELRSATRKRIIAFTDSVLCTHFGLSGPCVLDMSRYFTNARLDDHKATLRVNWQPHETQQSFDQLLIERGRSNAATSSRRRLAERGLPIRLAEALCAIAGIDPALPLGMLTRLQRLALVEAVTNMPLYITGDRGFAHAEVTAGGIPLSEIRLESMESRKQPGLHIIGEVCDVDGRIGGYNFQWAWSSGYVAGCAVVASLK